MQSRKHIGCRLREAHPGAHKSNFAFMCQGQINTELKCEVERKAKIK